MAELGSADLRRWLQGEMKEEAAQQVETAMAALKEVAQEVAPPTSPLLPEKQDEPKERSGRRWIEAAEQYLEAVLYGESCRLQDEMGLWEIEPAVSVARSPDKSMSGLELLPVCAFFGSLLTICGAFFVLDLVGVKGKFRPGQASLSLPQLRGGILMYVWRSRRQVMFIAILTCLFGIVLMRGTKPAYEVTMELRLQPCDGTGNEIASLAFSYVRMNLESGTLAAVAAKQAGIRKADGKDYAPAELAEYLSESMEAWAIRLPRASSLFVRVRYDDPIQAKAWADRLTENCAREFTRIQRRQAAIEAAGLEARRQVKARILGEVERLCQQSPDAAAARQNLAGLAVVKQVLSLQDTAVVTTPTRDEEGSSLQVHVSDVSEIWTCPPSHGQVSCVPVSDTYEPRTYPALLGQAFCILAFLLGGLLLGCCIVTLGSAIGKSEAIDKSDAGRVPIRGIGPPGGNGQDRKIHDA